MPSKAELRQKWNELPEDKVLLHSFTRCKTRPMASPFAVKLETYLRIAGIDYEVEHSQPYSTKSKTPWITFNKEDFNDSQLIMEMLAEKLDKNLNKNLSDEKKALSRAMRIMLEDHFYWCHYTLTFTPQKIKHFRNIMAPLPVPEAPPPRARRPPPRGARPCGPRSPASRRAMAYARTSPQKMFKRFFSKKEYINK